MEANCVVFSNFSRVGSPKSHTIPQKSMEAALVNLNRANAVDP